MTEPPPALVRSEDVQESSRTIQSNELDDAKNGIDRKAIAYLLRYETMIKQQEAEDMATMAHLRPLLERVQLLGSLGYDGRPTKDSSKVRSNNALVPEMERIISYAHMQRAMDNLRAALGDDLDDEDHPQEFMTTDQQLMLVLKTLTQKDCDSIIPEEGNDQLTWAEFLQCYKVVVGGVQTLEHLSGSAEARARAKDRTLCQISLFESPTSRLLGDRETSGGETDDGDGGALGDHRRLPASTLLLQERKAPSQVPKILIFLCLMILIVLLSSNTVVQKLLLVGPANQEHKCPPAPTIPLSSIAATVDEPKLTFETPLPIPDEKGEEEEPLPIETEVDEENELEREGRRMESTRNRKESSDLESLMQEYSLLSQRFKERTAISATIGASTGVVLSPVILKTVVGITRLGGGIWGLLAVAAAPLLRKAVRNHSNFGTKHQRSLARKHEDK